MIVEMRTYKLKPDMRLRFLEIFRSKSIPEHRRLGMKITVPYVSVDDPNTLFFVRGFPDLASRDSVKAAFFEGTLWRQKLESVLMPMIDKYDVVVVDDTEHPIQW
jgi:NIPSNAP